MYFFTYTIYFLSTRKKNNNTLNQEERRIFSSLLDNQSNLSIRQSSIEELLVLLQ
nr:MAG TPA: hypothetical protein [Caudoviricetes sp.]